MITLSHPHPVAFTADPDVLAQVPGKIGDMLVATGWQASECAECGLRVPSYAKRDGNRVGRFCAWSDADEPDGCIVRAAKLFGLSPVALAHRLGLRAVPTAEQIERLAELEWDMSTRAGAFVRIKVEHPEIARSHCLTMRDKFPRFTNLPEPRRLAVMAVAREMGLLPEEE